MLGIVNHWIPLVIYKKSKHADAEFYFLDSRNIEYLDWKEEELDDRIDERDRIHDHLTGRIPRKPFFTEYFKHSLYDT